MTEFPPKELTLGAKDLSPSSGIGIKLLRGVLLVKLFYEKGVKTDLCMVR